MIRTVLGDIKPSELGVCDCHEHLIRSYGPEIQINAWYKMCDLEAACADFQDYVAVGGKAVVCMDPIGCGRDVPKMMQIAERFRGRAHIIMTTGFHKGSLYDNVGHFSALYSPKETAKLIADEVNIGMDYYSYAGPIVKRVDAKAGIIKGGVSLGHISAFEKNILTVIAMAQQECGAPISIHTDMGTMGLETIAILKNAGADIEHCILCHTNKLLDINYHKKMLDMGINLCFEGPNRPEWATDTEIAEHIKTLIDAGYGGQILLSMDAGRKTWHKHYMEAEGKIASGFSYLLTDFLPLLRAVGMSEQDIQTILVENPAKVLSIWK